jgi:hypothetical protein
VIATLFLRETGSSLSEHCLYRCGIGFEALGSHSATARSGPHPELESRYANCSTQSQTVSKPCQDAKNDGNTARRDSLYDPHRGAALTARFLS